MSTCEHAVDNQGCCHQCGAVLNFDYFFHYFGRFPTDEEMDVSERRERGVKAPNNGAKPHRRRGAAAKRRRQEAAIGRLKNKENAR